MADVIDGNVHPELFFPTELFESLVRTSFVTLPSVYPRVVEQRSTDVFLESGEWETFSAIVVDYAVLLANERDLVATLSSASRDQRVAIEARLLSVRAGKCATARRTLREARQTFGSERFDRMLYEVVPPGMSVTFGSSDSSESVNTAVWRERHCQ